MKVTKNELVDVVKEAIEDGWFSEVTEEVLNDEIESLISDGQKLN